ncbi:MAG TPA: CPBP family intramembrane glutamic endopeptidase [Phycisphaerae bacterium]|nr:CPBP family intramembrane glutamic endopeptidase [Phycisphaerae bacterium]HUU23105.1 CPBP family intramembrane glutamic endopeptidase [Phycisphaerae bacterium]
MARAGRDLQTTLAGYLDKTHRPLNCLLFVLPLLAAYEAGAVFFGEMLRASADMTALLRLFGARGALWPAVVVVGVLLAWHVWTRQRWHVDAETLLGMVVESVLWAAPLVLMSHVLSRLAPPSPWAASALLAAAPRQQAVNVLVGLGAGVYEEFLFRLGALGLFLLVCVKWAHARRKPMIVIGAIVTSVLFSLYHFIGVPQFHGMRFVFYAAAGGYLATMYVLRGFGVAVGVHAFYNILAAVLRG